MRSTIKTFLIYSLPGILSRFLFFLVVPITTAYLSIDDFALLALFALAHTPFKCFVTLGVEYLIPTVWFTYAKKKQGELLFALLMLTIALHAFAVLFVTALSRVLFPVVLGDSWQLVEPLYWLLVVSVLADIPIRLFASWVTIEERPVLSTAVQSFGIVLWATVVVALTVTTRNVHYIVIGSVCSSIAVNTLKLVSLLAHIRKTTGGEYYKLVARVCTPIFFRGMLDQARSHVDKFFIVALYGGAALAIFGWAKRFHAMYRAFASSLVRALAPRIHRDLAKGELDSRFIKKILLGWFYLVLMGACMFLVFGERVIEIVTHNVFTAAYPIIVGFLCCIVMTCTTLGHRTVVLHYQQTKFFLWLGLVAAVSYIFTCILLIPAIGIAGGIIAHWVSAFLVIVIRYLKKRSLCRDPFIEAVALPYAVAFHFVALWHLFGPPMITLVLIALLMAICTYNFILSPGSFMRQWK